MHMYCSTGTQAVGLEACLHGITGLSYELCIRCVPMWCVVRGAGIRCSISPGRCCSGGLKQAHSRCRGACRLRYCQAPRPPRHSQPAHGLLLAQQCCHCGQICAEAPWPPEGAWSQLLSVAFHRKFGHAATTRSCMWVEQNMNSIVLARFKCICSLNNAPLLRCTLTCR